MKNKKLLLLIISIVIVISLSFGMFIFINKQNNISQIENELSHKNYSIVYSLIRDNHLSKSKKVETLLSKELEQYIVHNDKDLVNLTEEDWKNINDFSYIGSNLNINNVKFNYLVGLIKLKEDYGEYFSSILWINSADYEQYQVYSQLNGTDESSISQTCNLLSKYSFEKYGLDSTYIKELNAETQTLLSTYNNILTALKTKNSNLLEDAKGTATSTLSVIADIQVNILLKSTDISKELQKLSNTL